MEAVDSRREQMFPKFAPAEIDRIRRFGMTKCYAKGALLLKAGEITRGNRGGRRGGNATACVSHQHGTIAT
jgi:hypothetical protein